MDGFSILDPLAWDATGFKLHPAYAVGNAAGWLSKTGAAATTNHYLAGRLYVSKSGWLLLSVPNALVRGVFDAMTAPGAELPLAGALNVPDVKPDLLNAHISVMTADEVSKIGADKINERGHNFHYALGPVKELAPKNIDGISRVWAIQVASPELAALRKSYGLSALPNGDHQFHITVAVRRKNVLGANEVAKIDGSRGELKTAAAEDRTKQAVVPSAVKMYRRAAVALANQTHNFHGTRSFDMLKGILNAGQLTPQRPGWRSVNSIPEVYFGRGRPVSGWFGMQHAVGIPHVDMAGLKFAPHPDWPKGAPDLLKKIYGGDGTGIRTIAADPAALSRDFKPWNPANWVTSSGAVPITPKSFAVAPAQNLGGLTAQMKQMRARPMSFEALEAAATKIPAKIAEFKDFLRGGVADNEPDNKFPQEALAEGKKHEREHTNNAEIAKEIAKDHLSEEPAYYKKIQQLEKDGGSVYLDQGRQMLDPFAIQKPIPYDPSKPVFENIKSQLTEAKRRGDFIRDSDRNHKMWRAQLDPRYRHQLALKAIRGQTERPNLIDQVIARYGDDVLAQFSTGRK